jgi:transcriptional regulator with XRE-family HTH domain
MVKLYGHDLYRIRTSAGISQKSLADLIGVSLSSLQKAEALGADPVKGLVRENFLARALEIKEQYPKSKVPSRFTLSKP